MLTKVLIAVPTAELSRQAKFWGYFMCIDKPENTVISFAHAQSPAANRNLLIRQALEHDCTHVFFVDDDVLIPRDTLTKLLAHDKDIVSGLYLMRNFPHAPIAFNVAMNNGACRHKFLTPGETGLVEVVNFGLGACLIKTDVFRKMPDPWIRIGQLNTQEWNDDIDFFNRAREQFGYKLWLDLNAPCGHIASITLWPEYKEDKWLTSYDTDGIGHASFYAANPMQIYGEEKYEQMLKERQHLVTADTRRGKY